MGAEPAATEEFPGIRFDERGLVACIVQDADTGDVLMVAYMNADALRLTQETGDAHFFSRSRNEIWHKGETSGNVMRVRTLRFDCDGDAILALVEPTGPACHTGERSCFYRDVGGSAPTAKDAPRADGEPASVPFEAVGRLGRTLSDRAEKRPDGSYTVELLDDPDLIGDKIREEAEEVTRAARDESDERVAEEAADLLYHLEVLLISRNVPRSVVMEVLDERAR